MNLIYVAEVNRCGSMCYAIFGLSTLQHWYQISLLYFQKQEEVNPGTEPTDMEGEQLISMVNKAVSAITTRLQSEYCPEGGMDLQMSQILPLPRELFITYYTTLYCV